MIKRGKGSTNKEVLEVSRCKGDVTKGRFATMIF